MTKERKLAIQMWLGIRDGIAANKQFSISAAKQMYCFMHNLEWSCSCWFCEYVNCSYRKCPLGSCGEADSLYLKVLDGRLSTEERLDACDKIIAALKGEYRV